jgi:hypothetical protein
MRDGSPWHWRWARGPLWSPALPEGVIDPRTAGSRTGSPLISGLATYRRDAPPTPAMTRTLAHFAQRPGTSARAGLFVRARRFWGSCPRPIRPVFARFPSSAGPATIPWSRRGSVDRTRPVAATCSSDRSACRMSAWGRRCVPLSRAVVAKTSRHGNWPVARRRSRRACRAASSARAA